MMNQLGGIHLSLLKIVTHPNEILETPCEKVTSFDKDLTKLLNNMYETMLAEDGVGLAAPQVGVLKQIAVVDVDDDNGRIDLINPVVMEVKGEQTDIEGCLSFPGLFGDVNRPSYAKIKAQNKRGKYFIIEARGFLARALLHEIDHLHGVLFTSKVTRYYTEDELEG
jgi:peptide deformylase